MSETKKAQGLHNSQAPMLNPFYGLVKIQKKEPDKYTEYGTEQQNYRYKHRECSHNESQKVTFFKICFLPFPHFLLLQQVFKFRFVDEH